MDVSEATGWQWVYVRWWSSRLVGDNPSLTFHMLWEQHWDTIRAPDRPSKAWVSLCCYTFTYLRILKSSPIVFARWTVLRSTLQEQLSTADPDFFRLS